MSDNSDIILPESTTEDKPYNLVLETQEKQQLVIVQNYYRAPSLKHALRLMLADVAFLVEHNQWGEIERGLRNIIVKGGDT